MEPDYDPERPDEKENPFKQDDTGDDPGETLPTEPFPSTSTPIYNPERKKADTSFIVITEKPKVQTKLQNHKKSTTPYKRLF